MRAFAKLNKGGPILHCAYTVWFILLMTVRSPALAEDYDVEYGIETSAGKDGGSVSCQFGHRCNVSVDSLKLRFNILVYHHFRGEALLDIDGDPACCLFEGAVSHLEIVTDGPLLPLRFFRGRPARGLEFFQNEYVGRLYLRFHFRKDLDRREAPGQDRMRRAI